MKYCFISENNIDVIQGSNCDIYNAIEDNCVQGVFIFEYVEPKQAILHVYSYNPKPSIPWADFYRDTVMPYMSLTLDYIFVGIDPKEKAKIRLFKSWGIPLKYNDEHSMYIAVQGL